MEFHPDKVDEFLEIFHSSNSKIRATKGCEYLELCQDTQRSNVYYTYSRWQTEDHLNEYRHSMFFKTTWAKTKLLFSAKPKAFSMTQQ